MDEALWSERRTHCWNLEPECTEERRKRCAAYFVRRNCWDLWAAEYFPPGRKPCCHPDLDCSECPVATAKFDGAISVYVEVPPRAHGAGAAAESSRPGTYCPHLFSTRERFGHRGDGESRPVFRCQRRRGISLHGSYVSEMCGTVDYRECPFHDAE